MILCNTLHEEKKRDSRCAGIERKQRDGASKEDGGLWLSLLRIGSVRNLFESSVESGSSAVNSRDVITIPFPMRPSIILATVIVAGFIACKSTSVEKDLCPGELVKSIHIPHVGASIMAPGYLNKAAVEFYSQAIVLDTTLVDSVSEDHLSITVYKLAKETSEPDAVNGLMGGIISGYYEKDSVLLNEIRQIDGVPIGFMKKKIGVSEENSHFGVIAFYLDSKTRVEIYATLRGSGSETLMDCIFQSFRFDKPPSKTKMFTY